MRWTSITWAVLVLLGCGEQAEDEFKEVTRRAVDPALASAVEIRLFAPIEQIAGVIWKKKEGASDSQTAFKGPSKLTIRSEGPKDAVLNVIGGLLTQRNDVLNQARLYLANGPRSLEESLGVLGDVAGCFGVEDAYQVKQYFKEIEAEQPRPIAGHVRLEGWHPNVWIGPADSLNEK